MKIDMIPKVIHYCWFGGNPLPESAKRCIQSWKKYMPDFEIKEWNESNFDINIISYTKEAYDAKKYAFVSDYARFWILYNYGGIYFDTDVELIKSITKIVNQGPFMGCETIASFNSIANVNPGVGLGATPQHYLYKEFLDKYSDLHFVNKDGTINTTTIVVYTMEILKKHGLRNLNEIQKCGGINIYPKEYFCPIDYQTGKIEITSKSVSIHHFTATWKTESQKRKDFFIKFLGPNLTRLCVKMKHLFNV